MSHIKTVLVQTSQNDYTLIGDDYVREDEDRHQWYSNKEIYEELTNISKDFITLRGEMKETRILIKQYNGLREEIEKVSKEHAVTNEKVRTILNVQAGRNGVWENLRNWGGWIFGLLTLIILIYNQTI